MKLLILGSKQYALTQWVTIKTYADVKDVENQHIHNWMRSGRIPKENILKIEELNNLILLRL